jgi:hypothetical protein
LVNSVAQLPAELSGHALAEGVRDKLYAVRDYNGASGATTFDRNGDALKPLEFRTIRNGHFQAAERQLLGVGGGK